MNKFKKILATTLALTTLLPFAACGGGTEEDPNKGDKNRTRTLSVSIFNGGYGMGWLYELKRGFEDIHKDVYIEVTPSYSDQNARTELKSGVSENDLFFMKDHYYAYVDAGNIRVGKTTYDSYYADLTDVVNGPAYGETETIGSKILDGKIEWLTSSKGKVHALPWGGGALGMIVNTDILTANNWEVPVTTDEMFAVFENIKNANLKNDQGKTIYATTFCTADDTMIRQAQQSWFAQYNGTEGWENYWNGIDENGEQYQPALLNNTGLLRSLEVSAKYLSSTNGYLHEYALTDDFVTTEFRLFNKECVFLPYGDWVVNECATNFTEEELKDVRFVKFPLVSAIVEKLDDSDMTDATLASIVREIDNGATSSTLCSAEDFAIIKDARSINLDISNIHLAVVPCYSDNIDLAKDFLRYVYSNTGIETFARNSRGNVMPVKYNYEGTSVTLNNYAKSACDVLQTSVNLHNYNAKHPIFVRNGLSTLNGDYNNWTTYFYTTSTIDKKTAKEIFEGNILYATTRWDTYTQNLV